MHTSSINKHVLKSLRYEINDRFVLKSYSLHKLIHIVLL